LSDASRRNVHGRTRLTTLATRDIGRGVPLTHVQAWAAASAGDSMDLCGRVAPSSAAYASLGHFGEYPQNILRDWARWQQQIRRTEKVDLEPYYFDCSLNLPEGVRKRKMPTLVPHEVFAMIYNLEDGGGTSLGWREGVHGPAGSIASYWEHRRNQEWYREHPATHEPDRLPMTVPFGVHGDDVQVFKNGNYKITAIQWNSLAVRVATLMSRFLSFLLMYELMVHDTSLNEYWDVFCWSALWLLRGYWPPHDHNRRRFIRSPIRSLIRSRIRSRMTHINRILYYSILYYALLMLY